MFLCKIGAGGRLPNDYHGKIGVADRVQPDPAAPDRREEAARLTREAMRLLDEAVRQRPGDWFWYNKRWILEKV